MRKYVKNLKGKKEGQVLLEFANPYRKQFVLLYICLAAESLIQSILPILVAKLIDVIVYDKSLQSFLNITILYGGCLLVFGLFSAIHPNIWQYLMNKYVFEIRYCVYQNIVNAKATYLSNMKSGDLAARIDDDVTECMNIIQRNIFHYINYIIKLLIIVIAVFGYNLTAGFVVMIFVPHYVIVTKKFGRVAEKQSIEERENYSSYISWMLEMIKGIREIKLLSADKNIREQFLVKYRNLVKTKNKISITGVVIEQIRNLIAQIVTCVLYAVLAYLAINKRISIGEITAILAYYELAKKCILKISDNSMQRKWRSASIKRICQIVQMDTEQDEDDKKELNITEGKIEFRNVCFTYNERKQVLDHFALTVQPGKHVSFVGKSGAGKTTIVSLLLKFYDVDSGEIMIDGQNIKECTYESVRKNIGIVLQEVFIFKGTIRYNLSLANRNATDEEMMLALEQACLADFVRSLPKGLDTELSYGGKELSGGQKQRLSIARIYLKKAKIIIFDEATSALDNESEREINKLYKSLQSEHTTISISHRLSTILSSEMIAVLENGRVVGYDTCDSLLKDNHTFRTLFEEQYFAEGGIME